MLYRLFYPIISARATNVFMVVADSSRDYYSSECVYSIGGFGRICVYISLLSSNIWIESNIPSLARRSPFTNSSFRLLRLLVILLVNRSTWEIVCQIDRLKVKRQLGLTTSIGRSLLGVNRDSWVWYTTEVIRLWLELNCLDGFTFSTNETGYQP